MKKHAPNQSAFTLIELMITITIIGVIAGFGIPSYTKMVSRAKERDAIINLELIREAVKGYMLQYNSDPGALADVDAINTTLYLGIFEQEDNVYYCDVVNTYTCRANNTPGGWRLWFRLNTNDGEIQCEFAGTCPTL